MKNLCSGSQCGGFQFLLILDLWGISFHAVVVFGLGKNILFKSTLGHCADLHKSDLFGFYSRQTFQNLLGRLSSIPQQSYLTLRAMGSQKSPEPLGNCHTFLTFVADLCKNMISSGIYFQGLIWKFCVGKRFCQKHYNFNITIQCTNVIFV